MVSQHESERLTEAFKREPLTGGPVILKCVAGLLAVAGVAVIGARSDTTDATAAAANQQRRQTHEKASIAHSKTLYQKRQTRLQAPPPIASIEIPSANAADVDNPNQ